MKDDPTDALEAEVQCINSGCGRTQWVSFRNRHAGNEQLPSGVGRSMDAHCEACRGSREFDFYYKGFTRWTGNTRKRTRV